MGLKEILFGGDFWDLVIKWSAIVIILWFFGKSFGYIHTSFFLANLPYLMGATAILGIDIKAGRVLEKVDNLEKNVDNIYDDVINMKDDIKDIDKKMISLER